MQKSYCFNEQNGIYPACEEMCRACSTVKPNINFENSPEDLINKPNHYHKGGIDVIGFAEQKFSKEELRGFYRINAIKYLTRYEMKGGVEDLDKTIFYVNKLKELEATA